MSRTCLLCSQRVSSRGVRSPQAAKPSLVLTRLPDLGGLKASGVRKRRSLSSGAVPPRAWLDSLAVPRTAPAAPHGGPQHERRREPLLDGSIDPQGSWQEDGEEGDAAVEVGVGAELTSDELWLSVREQPGFSVERLGGQRIVELVSAWDRLAPQLPPDVGNGAAAQVSRATGCARRRLHQSGQPAPGLACMPSCHCDDAAAIRQVAAGRCAL